MLLLMMMKMMMMAMIMFVACNGALADTMYLPERCSTSSLTGFNKGVIISQRGSKYAPDTRCTLHLRVRSSARAIRFTFEHMDLPELRPGHCEDYLEFRTPPPDGSSGSSLDDSVAGPFCGRTLPGDFYSNGTGVLVTFTSNGIRQRSGFRFRFERISYAVELYAGNELGDVIGQHGVDVSAHSGVTFSLHVDLIRGLRLPEITRDVKASRPMWPRGQIIRPRPHSSWPRSRSRPHGIWPWLHRNWPRGLEYLQCT